MNLVSDGHGGWLDSRGNFVASTEGGKLKFVDKKETKGQEEPTGKPKAAAQPEPKEEPKTAPPEATSGAAPEKGAEDPEMEGPADTLTVAFGRFNPPTVGHGKLLSAAKKSATGGDLKIYPSRSQDPKKNPLDPDMKISFMKKMFPDYSDYIINDDEMRSISMFLQLHLKMDMLMLILLLDQIVKQSLKILHRNTTASYMILISSVSSLLV